MSNTDDSAAMPPPAIPASHHRSTSSIAQSPRSDAFKRLSMEEFIPASLTSTRPNSMITTFTEEPSELSSPGSRQSFSFEPVNAFLTAVAAQERRVLELREELHKAENDLTYLKSQWAQQESYQKQRNVQSHVEAMRPLTSPTQVTPTMDRFPHRTSLSLEDERKKALFTRPRVPERKVLTGRHTRTLSLLSPTSLGNMSPVQGSVQEGEAQTPKTGVSLDAVLSREAQGTTRPHANSRGTRDDLMNTGKQFVGDLRQGLWSFWDDLRQATVGDEAAQEPLMRRHSQARSSRTSGPYRNDSSPSLKAKAGRPGSRSPHIRSATIAAPPTTPARKHSLSVNALGIAAEGSYLDSNGEDGGWSNWDSPAAKTVTSAAETGPSSPANSTPRTSVSSTENDETKRQKAGPSSEEMGLQPSTPNAKEGIPWPSLQKLSPSNLQRTASNIMKEWERSLSPPADDSKKDWIDKYIDGPRKRTGTKDQAEDTREPED